MLPLELAVRALQATDAAEKAAAGPQQTSAWMLPLFGGTVAYSFGLNVHDKVLAMGVGCSVLGERVVTGMCPWAFGQCWAGPGAQVVHVNCISTKSLKLTPFCKLIDIT